MRFTTGLKNCLQQQKKSIATIDGDRKRTWQEVGDRVARLAGAYRQMGLQIGDRAAILSPNCDRYLEFYFSVFWAGGVVVPLNTRLSASEIEYLLNDSETQILLIDRDFIDLLPDLNLNQNSVKHVICMGCESIPDGLLDYEAVIEKSEPIDDSERGGDDLAGIIYTGGTTGRPKGVMLTHRNFILNAFNSITIGSYNSDTIFLHAAPMFHLADAGATCSVTMVGGTHAFCRKFIPDRILEIAESNRVTNIMLVPTMVNMLLQSSNFDRYDLSSLKRIVYGAAPMPEEVLRKALQKIPNCGFGQGYGLTETSPLITILEPKYHALEGPLSKLKSAGKPCPTHEVKIVDHTDEEVPRGTIGEIVVRGANVMKGYWKNPEATSKAIRNGWLHTEDAGYMDEDGFVYISDRLKDMIISGGENVYSIEVENVLHEHPAVKSCAVFGIPHPQWGEAVHAVVVHDEGVSVTEQEIIDFSKKRLGGFKHPRSVEFQTDPLPMSGANKISKKTLRERYWKGRERQVN